MLRSNRAVVSVLGVTVIANFFLFSYFPIIPVIAEDLDASAFFVGLLIQSQLTGWVTALNAVYLGWIVLMPLYWIYLTMSEQIDREIENSSATETSEKSTQGATL